MAMESKGKMTGNETIDTKYQYNTDNEYNDSNNINQTNLPRDDLMLIENGNNTTSSPHTTTSNNDDGCTINYENHAINSDDDNSDNEEKQMYPSDCYSFLSLYGPMQNPVFFFFGLVICLFQLAFLSLFVLSVLHKNLASNGEVDNPDGGLLAQFVHSDADPLVRATQILAIISYSLFAESSLQDVITAVETFPRFDTVTNDDKTRRMIFSCLLRFIQGAMAIFSSFVLVVNSFNVIEIILNFTAVNFISNIDDVAFLLAKSGKYGSKLEEGAQSIENHPLPECMSRSTKNRRFCYTIMFTLLLMLAFIFAIMYAQVSDNFWRTTTFRIEFDEGTGLEAYTGCYELDTTQGSRGLLEKKRKIYTNLRDATSSLADSSDAVHFGYCRENRRWFMYKGNESDPCLAGEDKLAQSVKTQSFDISTSYGDTWTSVSGSPLNLYFIDLNNETLAEQCDSFENGICDDDFNSIDFRYDGGDCCVATCSRPSCGTGNFTEAFGVTLNASGVVGFPDCIDPSMVPITIHLQNIVRSSEPQYISLFRLSYTDDDQREDLVQSFGNFEGIRANFDEFVNWVNEKSSSDSNTPETLSHVISDPILPSMSLYCDQKNVISINIDKSMEDQYEVVMVEDGAKCTLDIENITTDATYIEEPIWYINYTIYHDEAMHVKIGEGFSIEEGVKQFTRIKDCFLATIFSYGYDPQKIDYTDLMVKSDWLAEHDAGNQPCSSDFSMERYALSIMDMASDDSSSPWMDGWMNDGMHCLWRRVECKQGLVVNLKYDPAGFIPKEIGILTNLEALDFSYQELTGSIPTEMGLLTKLIYLSLPWNELTGSIPTEVGLLTELTSLGLYSNELTGSIPMELFSLSNLVQLDLDINNMTNSIPTEIGYLTNLDNLRLAENELSGSIPTEVGLLTDLTALHLTKNELSGTMPTEIGLLTDLTTFWLRNNELTGSIPTEIGRLTELRTLYLDNNKFEGSIPSELGLLTSLQTLDLGGNLLTSAVPSEIAQLANMKYISLANTDLTGTLPFSNLTVFETIYIYNSSMTTESIPTSLLVEPCTLCDDGGTFDYKETDNVTDLDDNKKDSGDSVLDDTVLELYNCTQEVEQLNDKNTYFLWWFSMLSVDECTDLKERCIDCHLKK